MLYREEILPYKRVNGGIKPVIEKKSNIISQQLIVLYLAAFCVSRVFMINALMPFGIAFFVAAYEIINLKATMVTGFIVIIGYASIFKGYLSLSHITVVLALMIVMLVLKEKEKNRIFKISVYAFLINAIFNIFFHIYFISGAFISYDAILAILESTVVMASVYIFSYGMPIYFDSKKRKRLSKEEMICLGFIFAIAISGLWDVKYMGFSARNMLTFFVVLAAGYIEGPALGAAWGITLGIVSGLSDSTMPVSLGVYGFCGLMTGIFKDLGKLISALAFVVSCAIMTFYTSGVIIPPAGMLDVIFPIIIFLIIPNKEYEKVVLKFDDKKKGMEFQITYIKKVKDMMDKKLSILSGTLCGLSEILSKNIDSELSRKTEINGMVEKLADRVCDKCESKTLCWKKEFYYSYDAFSELLGNIERLGSVGFDEVPQTLRRKCIRANELVKQANYIFEIFRLNNKWRKKLINSKIIVSEQVKGISKIMKSMTDEIAISMDFKSDIEEEIAVALDRKGLEFEDILAIKNAKGKYEVTVYRRPCEGRQECSREFAGVVSRTLGVRMAKEGGKCKINNDSSICQFKFVEAESYSVITAVSRASKEEVSGDNYSYGEVNDGRYMIALSDGMGSGVRASIESNTTISLLEKFIEAGFDRNIALKAINSVLVLRSCDESFATIDLGIIDLHSGMGEFVKIGSAPTFIKSGMEVDVIKSTSIPAGILDEINIESQIIDLKTGDMIIMVTDGVIDANDASKEKWIVSALKKFDSGNPKDVAEHLMNSAKSYYGNNIGDDMTVIVSKIWRLI